MISAPEDYGLSGPQTLAHRAEARPPEGFEQFWSALAEAAASAPGRFAGRLDAPFNEVLLRSLDDVRVVGHVHLPNATPVGLLVTSHGYVAAPHGESDLERWTERGLAAMRVSVRGYPPSTMDMPELGVDWILHRIETTHDWIVRGAVVDVVTAVRTLRRALPGLPLALHGASLGGGLAVLAAALLTRLGAPPDRLILDLPSLGDWAWRAGRYCNGSGGRVNVLLEALAESRHPVLERMRMLDAALVAPEVSVPALVKLALRDDVVPAPSAAAIFNALASRPKLRFVTGFGHYDGGIADARRHARFEQMAPHFADPALDPAEFRSRHATELDEQPSGG